MPGLLGVDKPVEFGGSGLDFSYAMVCSESLGWVNGGSIPMGTGVQISMATPALARYGSDELRQEFLAPSISGDDGDTRVPKRLAKAVEILDPEVEHPLMVRREIFRVGRERREDAWSRLGVPRAIGGGADTKMCRVPVAERIRVLCPKENPPIPVAPISASPFVRRTLA